MSNHVLKILNDEEELIIKNMLIDYTFYTYIHKMPIWYGHKNKFLIDNLNKHDFETIYCINNINPKSFDGVSFENFINKNYCVLYFTFKYFNKSFIGYNTGNYISYGVDTCKPIHNEIILYLQNSYILLKQILNFKDINQYIFKIYANVIL